MYNDKRKTTAKAAFMLHRHLRAESLIPVVLATRCILSMCGKMVHCYGQIILWI